VYIPDILKRGVIITLHKGGSKPKDNPDSHRAITLTSIVLKLFESVLLQRCSTNMMADLNIQQCGFQEGLGCLMTSFMLRESVYFAREHGSKLYVCYLDGRQAFDKVWHYGLFYKLQTKIDDTSLLAFMELYANMTSCVKNRGHTSKWFHVRQRTRQGGKNSPICYLVYINGLINALEHSGQGFCMYGLNVNSPTVADDMIHIAFSKHALDGMMKICYDYSC